MAGRVAIFKTRAGDFHITPYTRKCIYNGHQDKLDQEMKRLLVWGSNYAERIANGELEPDYYHIRGTTLTGPVHEPLENPRCIRVNHLIDSRPGIVMVDGGALTLVGAGTKVARVWADELERVELGSLCAKNHF